MEPHISDAIVHAQSVMDKESCGLFIIHKGRTKYFPCENNHSDPYNRFSISTTDWVNADAMGEIVGVVHSHPTKAPVPSQADIVSCEKSGLPWTIVNPRTQEFRTVNPTGYKAPLYGREYCHGVIDCYSFVRDFYAQEYNVILRDYERQDDWWHKGFNLYKDFMSAEGFYPILLDEVKPGDGFILNITSGVGNHGAIYLGDNLIAHHLYGRLSSRDIYGEYYRKHTLMCVRHRDINQ